MPAVTYRMPALRGPFQSDAQAAALALHSVQTRRVLSKRTRQVEPLKTAHCGYLSGVLGRPEKAGKGDMDTSVLSGEEAALAGLYAARRG